MCEGFRLDLKFVENPEGLRQLLEQLLIKQVELMDRVKELEDNHDFLMEQTGWK